MKPKGLFDLCAHVAEQQDVLLERAAPEAGVRHQLARRVEERRRGVPPKSARFALRAWLAAAALLATTAWGAVRLVHRSDGDEPLRFTVGGRTGILQAWERASSSDALILDFSDGSTFLLAPGSRARVLSADARGAVLMVESGHLHADVVPKAGVPGRWRVQSGPFEIEVKGTRFDVGWNPQSEEFSLRLFEGEVKVSGCSLGAGLSVHAQQEVLASCRRQQFELGVLGNGTGVPVETHAPVEAGRKAATAAEERPRAEALQSDTSAAPVRSEPMEEASGRSARDVPQRRSAERRRWIALARQGQFAQAYELAEPSFASECRRGRVDEVLLLADAARHSGHLDAARRAYEAVRNRAGGSTAGAAAAFELGRLILEEDPEEAGRWFDISLTERPRGPLAQAALDRSLEAAVRIKDTGRRRRVAERYLQLSPDGPRANEARAVLNRLESEP